MMPRNLFLVRHGHSVGNALIAAQKAGRDHPDLEFWQGVDDCARRLDENGRDQARQAGQWLREQGLDRFQHFFTSDYARARETASLLGLPGAKWRLEFYLRERERGREAELLSHEDYRKRFADSKAWKERHAFYWRPEHGESMADVCQRVNRVLDTLWRDASGQDAVVVCHEETMWAFRMRIEKLSPEEYLRLDVGPKEVHNLTIWHYTRVHPDTGHLAERFTHRYTYHAASYVNEETGKRTEPHALGPFPIERGRYSNEDLLSGLPPTADDENWSGRPAGARRVLHLHGAEVSWAEIVAAVTRGAAVVVSDDDLHVLLRYRDGAEIRYEKAWKPIS
jgi:broad specificity phosphatase PhoE